jgi:hypothetical protein
LQRAGAKLGLGRLDDEREACRTVAAVIGHDQRAKAVALALAARISAWTWQYRREPAPKPVLTREQVTARRAEGGHIAASRRRSETEAILVGAALHLRDSGAPGHPGSRAAAGDRQEVTGEKRSAVTRP